VEKLLFLCGPKLMKAKQIKQQGELKDSKPLINLRLANSYKRIEK
jgi:hypothetical protein